MLALYYQTAKRVMYILMEEAIKNIKYNIFVLGSDEANQNQVKGNELSKIESNNISK